MLSIRGTEREKRFSLCEKNFFKIQRKRSKQKKKSKKGKERKESFVIISFQKKKIKTIKLS